MEEIINDYKHIDEEIYFETNVEGYWVSVIELVCSDYLICSNYTILRGQHV